jgi:hypothetical protein
MRKIAQTIALTLAALAAANAIATDDFRVVVPLYGKKAVNEGIELKVADLPAGAVAQDYGPVDFTPFLVITSDKPFDRAGVSWTALSPLPAGLTLTADGYLKGVPTAAAVDAPPFTVSATYAGKSAAQTYTVTVTPAEPDGPEIPPTPPETGGKQVVSDGDAILTVAPTKLVFGLVARQLPTQPLTVGLSNTGTKAAALTVEQPLAPEFKLTHNCPTALPPGAACEAAVVFTPKTVYEVKSTFNVWLGKQPVTVSLSGRGQNSAATFTHLPKKQSYQDFGTVAAGQFVARQTVIKNTSKYYALGIFDAKPVAGYNGSAQYAIDNDECPKVLAVGESCTITSRFMPTAEGRIATYGRVTMNISGDRQDFYMTGLSAGSLKITSQSHANALLPGGQQLTVYGSGFLPDAKVFFGDTEAVTRYGNINYLYATVPAVAEPENTYVRVVNPDEAEASAPKPFKRARSFGVLSVAGPLQFGKQALNVPSQWQYYYVRNQAAYSADTLEINDIQVTGPYQLDTSSSNCKVGTKVNYGNGSCTVRVRFVPTEVGDMPGTITVIGNGEPLTMNLTGVGLAWEGTPSGSPSANTDLPYSTVLSGNEPVGGASQTKFVDVYFRNTNPNAQLNAVFQLADGSAFKFYTVYATTNTGGSNANLGCVPNSTAKQTTVCRADVGSGTRPHIWVRLQATSAAGLGTHYEELVVLNVAGEEQFRVPLWLDVVYDVTAEPYADSKLTTPTGEISVAKVQLAQEAYKDVWVANVGTQGMMRTETVSLVDSNSPDIYFKYDSLYRASAGNTGLGGCGKLVSATEFTGCLSDDISGAATTYQHQRVRVYYKPMSSGARTATLRIVHRGQGNNPLELPVTISPVDFNAVFSANPSTGALAEVPTFRVPYNFAVDNTSNTKAVSFYLNTTDGQPLKGSFILSGAGTEDTRTQFSPGFTNAGGTGIGGCSMKNRLETILCGGQVNYPNFVVRLTLNSAIGEGVYNWKVTYYDPSMNELASVPVNVEFVNDAQFEVSASHNVGDPLPNGVLDFGTTSAPVAPGQVMTTVNKLVYLRNLGTMGKIKFSSAAIEGGDGAFTLTNPIYVNSSIYGASSFASCGSTKATDGYSASACVGRDPSTDPGVYNVGRFAVSYKATAAGRQNAVLKVWHNSKVGPNPIEIPLTAMAAGAQVAGEPSSAANAAIAPTGTYTPISNAGTRDLNFWVRNTEAYGPLYAQEISVEGDAFTLVSTPYKASEQNGVTSCGSTLSADKHWATACLADDVAGTGLYRNLRFTVRCTATTAMPKGTVNTGVLRIKTLGAEHTIPLSCTKS